MLYSYVIISNDASIIDRLLKLPENFPHFNCIGYESEEMAACDLILTYKPDFIFLDLDNPEILMPFGFVGEFHKYFEEIPNFIGVSNSKDLAYEAIKNDFRDYLLKPLSSFDLRKTLMRLKIRYSKANKICLKSYSEYHFIELGQIIFLKADNNTTDFYLRSGKKITAFKSLKVFEGVLPDNFKRVHKSYLVNSMVIVRINFSKKTLILKSLVNEVNVPFSRNYQDSVKEIKNKLINSNLFPIPN